MLEKILDFVEDMGNNLSVTGDIRPYDVLNVLKISAATIAVVAGGYYVFKRIKEFRDNMMDGLIEGVTGLEKEDI